MNSKEWHCTAEGIRIRAAREERLSRKYFEIIHDRSSPAHHAAHTLHVFASLQSDIRITLVPIGGRNRTVADDFAARFWEEDDHGNGHDALQRQQKLKDGVPSSILRQKTRPMDGASVGAPAAQDTQVPRSVDIVMSEATPLARATVPLLPALCKQRNLINSA